MITSEGILTIFQLCNIFKLRFHRSQCNSDCGGIHEGENGKGALIIHCIKYYYHQYKMNPVH